MDSTEVAVMVRGQSEETVLRRDGAGVTVTPTVRRVARVALALYMVAVVLIVILKFDGSFQDLISIHQNILATRAMGEGCANVVPFATIGTYVAQLPEDYAVRGLLGGAVAFVPLGILLPLAFKRAGLARTLLAGLALQLVIEVVEVVCAIGFFDVDDIILGVLGTAVGYLVVRLGGALYTAAVRLRA